MKPSDLRRSEPVAPASDFENELIDALPYSEIPHVLHARDVIEFFLEHGWTPPGDAR